MQTTIDMLRIGMRVEAATDLSFDVRTGDIGTIRDFKNDYIVAVEWDRYVRGHRIGGLCEDGYGTYALPRELNVLDVEDKEYVNYESLSKGFNSLFEENGEK